MIIDLIKKLFLCSISLTPPSQDSEYVDLIKETINDVANDYKNDTKVDAVRSPWDTMKMQIRPSSLHYAEKKKTKMKSQESSVETDILSL